MNDEKLTLFYTSDYTRYWMSLPDKKHVLQIEADKPVKLLLTLHDNTELYDKLNEIKRSEGIK